LLSRRRPGTFRAPVTHHHLSPLLLAALLATACSTPSATSPADGAPALSASVEAARVAASASAPVAAAPPAASAPVAAAEPAASASAAPPASAAPAASAAPPAAPEAPLPNVKVANIGMHIGGGPNDAVTKEPIHKSVIPHYDEFRRCYGLLEDQKKGGTFGIDLLIDKAGGKPKSVTKPRSPMKGHEFSECMVHAFEQIDFQKPKGGTTKVSYSLRFTP
jgi:pyruvate/2-oxoglutarate dehydrogenase complex dihydrolipoamide acyltransferase (E2) component